MNLSCDCSTIMDWDEVNLNSETDWTAEQITAGEMVGFELLGECHVYDVEPEGGAQGKAFVYTTWATSKGKDGLTKYRVVGRRFKWTSARTDTFAALSQLVIGRLGDLLFLKDDDGLSDSLVSFEGAVCANFARSLSTRRFTRSRLPIG